MYGLKIGKRYIIILMFKYFKKRKIKRKVRGIETLIFLTRDSLYKQINNSEVHLESITETTKIIIHEEDIIIHQNHQNEQKKDIVFKNINSLKFNNNVIVLPNLEKEQYSNLKAIIKLVNEGNKCFVIGLSQSDLYHLKSIGIDEDLIMYKWPNFKEIESCSTYIKRIIVDECVKSNHFDILKPILQRMKIWTENIKYIVDIYPGAKDECLIKKVFKSDDLVITRDLNLHNQLRKDDFNSLFMNGSEYCTFTTITKNDVKNGNYNAFKEQKMNDHGFDKWVLKLKKENIINKISSTIFIDKNLVFIEEPYRDFVVDKKLIKTNMEENIHDVNINIDGSKFLRRGYLIDNLSSKIGTNTFIDVENLEEKYENYENLGYNLGTLRESIIKIIERINTKKLSIGKYDSHVFWSDKMYLKFPTIFKDTKIYDVIGTRISSVKEEKLLSLLSEIDSIILDNQNPFELKTKGVSKTLDTKKHKYIALDRSYIKDEIFFGLSKTEFIGAFSEYKDHVDMKVRSIEVS